MSERAAAVAAKPAAPVLSQAPVGLQRQCACGQHALGGECEACKKKHLPLQRKENDSVPVSGIPSIVHEVLGSPAPPLDRKTRMFFESKFARDLSKVRVHTDAKAAESARALHARAYTVGNDIVFGDGQFDLARTKGARLLAHELAHTLQQSHGLTYGQPTVQHEREADAAAETITRPHASFTIGNSSSVGIARQEDAGAPPPDAGAPPASQELTEQDAKSCSPLYLQKLCIHIRGGFNGDRSGVETPEEMAGYNRECRAESGYAGDDVGLSDEEKRSLKTPRCSRGDPDSARKRARAERISKALDRSIKYMPGAAGQELVHIITDPVFLASLAIAVTVYLALWVVPEPIFTKIAAAATTIAILSTGLFSISTIVNLARTWGDLDTEAGAAQTDEEIERAAKHFGERMGALEADLLVFLASLLVGGKIPGPKRFPPAGKALADAERVLSSAQPNAEVITGPWGRGRTVVPSGDVAPVEGNLALKIEPAPIAPKPVVPAKPAQVIPFPVKPAPQPATFPGKAIGAATGAAVALAAQQKEKEKSGFYPLCWSHLLPPTPQQRVFVRTPRRERDVEEQDQARMQAEWRRFRDPDFDPGKYHVHHIVPLFLGGEDDLRRNGKLWPKFSHLRGHADLRHQPLMRKPPAPLPPLPEDLYDPAHVAGTKYVLVGFKGMGECPPGLGDRPPGEKAE